MKKMLIVFFATALIFLSTSNAFGQLGFYLGIQAGVSAQKISLTGVEFDTNTAFLYGIRVGAKFMMFGLEASYFQVAHNLELKELVTFSWGEREVDYSFVGLNLKYILSLALLHPYVTVGYGYYTVNILNIDQDSEGGFNFGLGLEVMLGNKFSLLAEGKYHHANVEIQEEDVGVGNFTFSGGLSIYF